MLSSPPQARMPAPPDAVGLRIDRPRSAERLADGVVYTISAASRLRSACVSANTLGTTHPAAASTTFVSVTSGIGHLTVKRCEHK